MRWFLILVLLRSNDLGAGEVYTLSHPRAPRVGPRGPPAQFHMETRYCHKPATMCIILTTNHTNWLFYNALADISWRSLPKGCHNPRSNSDLTCLLATCCKIA